MLFNTDTLDLRWSPEVQGGRWWVAARGEAIIAGLMRTPWHDGEPAPERARAASYAGVEAGRAFYLPGATWASASAATRSYVFGATDDTDTAVAPIPPTTHVLTPDLAAGWWTPGAQVYARLSADVRSDGPQTVSPAAYGELRIHPAFTVAPRVELRGGVADGQDDITRTRLGGMVPYSVPVAGTSWAEWWVEDFAAARAGLSLRWDGGFASLLADTATFDGATAEGFGVDVVHEWSPWRLELAAGYAPRVPRKPDVHRFSSWLRVTREWAP